MAIEIRLARPSDRDTILQFIEAMGFHSRDAVTWDALAMTAMTAWEGSRLLGAIPLEPRRLHLTPTTAVPTVHETTVAVHPEFRDQGIGSLLQEAICAQTPAGAVLATVYRECPDSSAYRWYCRNRFEPMMHIQSWYCDEPALVAGTEAEVAEPADGKLDWRKLVRIWEDGWSRQAGGFVNRSQRPLAYWLTVHPYRTRYAFRLVILRDREAQVVGYALLGINNMHSTTTRVDVLELAAADDDEYLVDRLFGAVTAFAARQGYTPVRWSLAATDPHVAVARRYRMQRRWEFDFLIRRLSHPAASTLDLSAATRAGWRFQSIEYI